MAKVRSSAHAASLLLATVAAGAEPDRRIVSVAAATVDTLLERLARGAGGQP